MFFQNKVIVITGSQNGIGKASARSIVGFDIGSAIISAVQENILVKGGGHKMAGGFTIKIENFEKFKKFIFKKYEKMNDNISAIPILRYYEFSSVRTYRVIIFRNIWRIWVK